VSAIMDLAVASAFAEEGFDAREWVEAVLASASSTGAGPACREGMRESVDLTTTGWLVELDGRFRSPGASLDFCFVCWVGAGRQAGHAPPSATGVHTYINPLCPHPHTHTHTQQQQQQSTGMPRAREEGWRRWSRRCRCGCSCWRRSSTESWRRVRKRFDSSSRASGWGGRPTGQCHASRVESPDRRGWHDMKCPIDPHAPAQGCYITLPMTMCPLPPRTHTHNTHTRAAGPGGFLPPGHGGVGQA
jgi:hypothetical protein